MAAMKVFLDTEFTDFGDCELVSIALVAEDGRTFYSERSDFRRAACSDFVREAVLPHLGAVSGASMTRAELALRLRAWLSALPAIEMACDSVHDRDLFADALDYQPTPNVVAWVDLNAVAGEPAFAQAEADYHAQPGQPWHHALHDARALRAGWEACSSDAKAKGLA
ncbi:3'-5' exoribonuclease [Niveibacterium sp. COAC-50]|uniref:3'-5' exoribonuclease n=1 Tax=Niveibacterium sp. COAC-50 TaxID=2729384 RepID=UPI001C12D0B5